MPRPKAAVESTRISFLMPNPDLEKVDKVAELRGTTRSVILRTIINGVLQGNDKKPRNEAA